MVLLTWFLDRSGRAVHNYTVAVHSTEYVYNKAVTRAVLHYHDRVPQRAAANTVLGVDGQGRRLAHGYRGQRSYRDSLRAAVAAL